MAKISIKDIEDIKVSVIPHERRFNSKGELALDSKVSGMYLTNCYDQAPNSSEEADARGLQHFNGLMSSVANMHVYPVDGKNIVTVDLAPTRYLVGQAMRDVVKEEQPSQDEIQSMSPDMANVSLIVPVKIGKEYFILSQIKGKALGSGQVHSGVVAGNIDAKYLNHDNPLVATLQNECSEELGLDLNKLQSTSFIYLVDERETGQINFASVAANTDMNVILDAYEAMTREKLDGDEKLEVMALARLPIVGLALTPLENNEQGVKGITTYTPSQDGLIEKVENRGVRPYTSAMIDYVNNKADAHFLLEKAGF